MNKIEKIQAFIAIADCQSFSKAAQTLGLSLPAVSRQLLALEQELKVTLIERNTRYTGLTAAGEQYYSSVKPLIMQLQAAAEMLGGHQLEAGGELRVLATPYYAEKLIFPRLKQFMQAHPKVKVVIETAERFPELNKEADIVFGVTMQGSENLVRKRIAETTYVLCAAPSYLAEFGIPSTPDQLIKHRYITHIMRTPQDKITLDHGLSVKLQPYLSLNSSSAMLECALQGLGVVWLHEYVVAEAVKNQLLVPLLKKFTQKTFPVYLYYKKTAFLPLKVRRFIDVCLTPEE